uniref:Uncharacterized protein n=1 Tax=Octopus bimaculoides TaxID=37653 RepID=A0A0L8FQQ9_OCTBM
MSRCLEVKTVKNTTQNGLCGSKSDHRFAKSGYTIKTIITRIFRKLQ